MQNTKTIMFNEAMVDIAISQYGDLSALFAIALANDLGITDDLAAGFALVLPDFDTSLIVLPNTESSIENKKIPVVTVLPMQTLSDLAIQETGTLENFFAMALLNGLGITDDIAAGTQLVSITPEINNVTTVRTLQQRKPASAGTIEEPGGIGYMQIQTSFKVS